MPDSQRMTRQQYTRLQNQLASLRSGRRDEKPNDSSRYQVNRANARTARDGQISDIERQLRHAVVDGRNSGEAAAEAGMVVTVRHETTGQAETFLLGKAGTPQNPGVDAYSMASPVGSAVAGARVGDQRQYSLEGMPVSVTVLDITPADKYHR